MKNYVTPELCWITFNAQDIVTASNEATFDVTDWLVDYTTGGEA